MDDLERASIGVIDADLVRRELVLQELVLDAFVRERAGGVKAERLKIAGEHLHGRDTTGLDRFDKLSTRRERKICSTP
jgi:hypothetical protein